MTLVWAIIVCHSSDWASHLFKRFRHIGLWSIFGEHWMVSIGLATSVATNSYRCERTGTYYNNSSFMGQSVDQQTHLFPFGQYGCCSCIAKAIFPLMHMVCCIYFYATFYGFEFSSQHIPGSRKADALFKTRRVISHLFFPRSQSSGYPTLDRAVHQLAAHGVARSMQKVYKSGQRHFLLFRIQFALDPLPVSEVVLCRFVDWMGSSRAR